MSELKIRKAKYKDLDRVVEISKNLRQLENYPNQKLGKSEFRKFVRGRYAFMFVAEVDKKIAGYITAFRSDDYLFLPFAAVDRFYRRKGIAGKLLEKIEKVAKREKRKYILFTAYENNKPVHNFAGKMGYKATRKLVQYYKLVH